MLNLDQHRIVRADLEEKQLAFQIVDEYCDSVGVVVRDNEAEFEHYFDDQSGIWLAFHVDVVTGCIALRPLSHIPGAAEVKRLYVKPQWRGNGIAQMLLKALHDHATACGYSHCYLDTKDDLTDAIQFYKLQGYEMCERYNDNPQATIFMRRSMT